MSVSFLKTAAIGSPRLCTAATRTAPPPVTMSWHCYDIIHDKGQAIKPFEIGEDSIVISPTTRQRKCAVVDTMGNVVKIHYKMS